MKRSINNAVSHFIAKMPQIIVGSAVLMAIAATFLPTAVVAQQTDAVCLYEQANYKGRKYCANTNVSLVPITFRARSLRLTRGYKLEAFVFPLYFGSNAAFTRSANNVGSKIAAIRSFRLTKVANSSSANATMPAILMLLDSGPMAPVNPDDRDGDGYDNDVEERNGSDPDDPNSTPPDIDNDKIPDGEDDDRDGDGVPDEVEDDRDTDPSDPNDFPDLVAPSLRLNNSTDIRTVDDKIILTGSVIEPVQPYSGLKSLSVSSSAFAGTTFTGTLNSITGQFSIEVPLRLGAQAITLSAVDLSSNVSSVLLDVTRGDIPTLVSLLPATRTIVTQASVDISGQVRASVPTEQFRVLVNESQITPQATNTPDIYNFSATNIPLVLGSNAINVRVESDFGGTTQTTLITYQPEASDELPAPIIDNIVPADGRMINQDDFRVQAQISSSGGPLTVSLNGTQVLSLSEGLTFYTLNELVSFVGDESTLSVELQAQDSLGKVTNKTVTYTRDADEPLISLDQPLQPLPNVNPIETSVFVLSGTVSDSNLSSFSINEQATTLSPGNEPNTYRFSVNLRVSGDIPTNAELAAYDRSGNVTRSEYALLNVASANINGILPPEDSAFVSRDDEPINLQVAARHSALSNAETIVAYLSSQPQQPVALEINGTLASGDLLLPAGTAAHTIVFEVRGPQGQRITADTTKISVTAAEDLPLDVLRIEPENIQANVEPNAPIEIYFNQSIDMGKLTVQVRETFNGKSYINNDPLGEDFINANGYVLADVNRNRELVPGQLDTIPGESAVVFSPSRNYGYSAEIYVDVDYDGQRLSRSRFDVRELPTFINGAISDQFGQPLKGIKVSLPELERETTTNGDGGFAFGYQESAENVIPSGSYRLLINDDFANRQFGTANVNINVQRNRANSTRRFQLQELDDAISFSSLNSNSRNVLLGGDLQIDLSAPNARAVFPNSRTSGPVHAQFLAFEHIAINTYQFAMPSWLFGLQPKGIDVEGDVKLRLKIPKLRGGYDYIDSESFEYVVLLGLNPSGQVIEPIGVGKNNGTYVESEGKVNMMSLDYLGYAQVFPTLNPQMADYAAGKITLQQLKAALQSAFQTEANAQQSN